MSYDTGTAAIVRSPSGLVAMAGFPLETVADADQRKNLIAALAVDMLGATAADGDTCLQEEPEEQPDPDPDLGGEAMESGLDVPPTPDAVVDVPSADQPEVSPRSLEVNVSRGCGCRTVRASGWFGLLVPLGLAVVCRRRFRQ